MDNGYRMRGYIDREKLSLIQVANMDLIYWSVRSYSRRGGDDVKEVNGVSLFQPAAVITFLKSTFKSGNNISFERIFYFEEKTIFQTTNKPTN